MYINAHIHISIKKSKLNLRFYGDNIKTRLFEPEISIRELENIAKQVNDAKVCGPSAHIFSSMKEISLKLLESKFLNELLYKKSGVIRFHISDDLRFFPWELISNGKTAICLKFQCSRIDDNLTVYKHIKKQKKAIIVSEQDLLLSRLGLKLRAKLKNSGWVTEYFTKNNNISYSSHDAVDAFYFLGHEPEGDISFSELLSISPPEANIVWIDTCRSGDPLNSKEIINRFKCSHFIGNIDYVPELEEEHKTLFVTESFFENITNGFEVAESLRIARESSFESGNFDWSYPVLYGEPKTIVFPEAFEKKRKKQLRTKITHSLILFLFTIILLFVISPYLPLPIHGKKVAKNKIVVYNSLGVKLWAYETKSEIKDKILTGDILGDYYPEIVFGTNCFDISENKLHEEESRIFIFSQQGSKLREISMKNENIYSANLVENMYEMYPETLIDIDHDNKLDIIWRATHHDNLENCIELIAADSYCISKNDLFSLRYWCRGKILDFAIVNNSKIKSTELIYIAELNNLGKRLIAGNIELEQKVVQKAKNQSVFNRLFCLAPPWLGTNTMPSKTIPESKDFQEKWLFLLPVFNDETLYFEILDDKVFIKSKNNEDIFSIGNDLCLYKNSKELNKAEITKEYWEQFKELMNSLTNDFIENAEISYNAILKNIPDKHYAGPPSFQYSIYLNRKGNSRKYKEVIQKGYEADSSVYNFYRVLEYNANNRHYEKFWELYNSNYAKYNEPFFSQLAFFVAIDQNDTLLATKFANSLKESDQPFSQSLAIFEMTKGNYKKAVDILSTNNIPNNYLLIESYLYLNKTDNIPCIFEQLSAKYQNAYFTKAQYYFAKNNYTQSLKYLSFWLEQNDFNYSSNLIVRINYPRVLWLMREVARIQENKTLEKQVNLKAQMIGGYGLIPPEN